ncbi:protein NLRC3 isoform X1 [Gadus morhua]|uniref:Protein NLRC3-like n=1 Tax=Gadus morhua TaxID=8049 RepID=A0A8C5A2Y2_GADMO|nr:protein NLRC3-like isoform X1 [Gadus morhua]
MASNSSPMDPPTLSEDGCPCNNNRPLQEGSEVALPDQSESERQLAMEAMFEQRKGQIISFVMKELHKMGKFMGVNAPEGGEEPREEPEEESDSEDSDLTRGARDEVVKLALGFLRNMNQDEIAENVHSKTLAVSCQRNLKSSLKAKSHSLFASFFKQRHPIIYNPLYVSESSGDLNHAPDIRAIEGFTLECSEIFIPLPGKDQPIRTMLTTGVSGIGKTVFIHKFIMEWADGTANQNVHFVFPFSFKELSLLRDRKSSLVELLHHSFYVTKKAEVDNFDKYRVVFILDGLDECRLSLDFKNNEICTDVNQTVSVDAVLTNLIQGNLLPSARIWITTQPAAAVISLIPPEHVDMVTEMRGFTDPQKEEYFRSRFKKKRLASKMLTIIKTSQSLYNMCCVPSFCWITGTVLEHAIATAPSYTMPKNVTEMYIHYLSSHCLPGNAKNHAKLRADPNWNTKIRKLIMALGKLAFDQVNKGIMIFYEEDLQEFGVDIKDAQMYPGIFNHIFKEERELYHDEVFTFGHLSLQEFLAAVYVFAAFINTGVNLLSLTQPTMVRGQLPDVRLIYQSAIDQALMCENGHLDSFVRFVLGLSVQSNQTLLRGVVKQTTSMTNQNTIHYVHKRIRENVPPENIVKLFHFLREMNDPMLVVEMQQYLRAWLSRETLAPAQWSALIFLILSSEMDLALFDLKKYTASEDTLRRLLPIVKASKISLLNGCNLSEGCCEALSSVLGSVSFSLRELDLSANDLQDPGVKLLSPGLRSAHCKLEILRLKSCNLSEASCEVLAAVLSSESCSLKELDLSTNNLRDSGVKLLCAGLESSHCKLETLRLSGCLVTQEGCASLASALSSNPSHLRELDLSYNHPGEVLIQPGAVLLSAGLEDPSWRLHTLGVEHCGEQRLKPGLLKYACELTLEQKSAHRRLCLSADGRGVTLVSERQRCARHADRFDYSRQVLCREGLNSRCYWEVEWTGLVSIGVTYKGITRKGESLECCLGGNEESWSLYCSPDHYTAANNQKGTLVFVPPPPLKAGPGSERVGVFLDWHAGTLSFYRVSSGVRRHVHTFQSRFTERLYPGFGFTPCASGSSVSLCQL